MHPPCLQNRFVIYKKGLEGEVDIQAPKLLGDKGVKSPAYLALNPQVRPQGWQQGAALVWVHAGDVVARRDNSWGWRMSQGLCAACQTAGAARDASSQRAPVAPRHRPAGQDAAAGAA